MKLTVLALTSAMALTSLVSTAWAQGPATPAPAAGPVAAAPHFSAPFPKSPQDMGQIKAAALRSFAHSPVARGLSHDRDANVTVSAAPQPKGFIGSGFPRVSVLVSAGQGMYNPLQRQPQATAKFTAMLTVDQKTGASAWKLTPIKNGGRVWQRVYTLAATGAPQK
jgi:hypothetical protein